MRRAVLSMLGLGALPGPSGTYASLATAGAIALARYDGVAVPVAGAAAAVLGSVATLALGDGALRETGTTDPRWMVTDELAGQGLAAALAYAAGAAGFAPLAASLLLFRLLDVTKPGPVGACERLPGALGVLADDLAAGAVAGGVVAGAGALGLFALPGVAW